MYYRQLESKDSSKNDDFSAMNSLYLKYIEQYLNLYLSEISQISSDRLEIAKELLILTHKAQTGKGEERFISITVEKNFWRTLLKRD